MLRPQVFALQRREESIGIVASEKQAIDALLEELQELGFDPIADAYWNARGGSYTDGGAFIYELSGKKLRVTDKFGKEVVTDTLHFKLKETKLSNDEKMEIEYVFRSGDSYSAFQLISQVTDFDGLRDVLLEITGEGDEEKECVIETLTLLMDRRYPLKIRRSVALSKYREILYEVLRGCPKEGECKYVFTE